MPRGRKLRPRRRILLREGEYTTLYREGDSLVIVLTEEGRAEADELLHGERKLSSDARLGELLEEHLANGWEWVAPETIGALTDAPIIAHCDEVLRDAWGEVVFVGQVFWHEAYAVEDPLEVMLRRPPLLHRGALYLPSVGKPLSTHRAIYEDYDRLRGYEDRTNTRADWKTFQKKWGPRFE